MPRECAGALAMVLLLAAAWAARVDATPAGSSVAPAAAPAGAAQQPTVAIVDRAFQPIEIVVVAGTSVTWTNRGRLPHTTTSPGTWDSGRLAPGASWSRQFDAPGTFNYICAIHPNEMRARIVVQEAAAPAPPAPTEPPSAPPQADAQLTPAAAPTPQELPPSVPTDSPPPPQS